MAKQKRGAVNFKGYTSAWWDFDSEEVCFSFWENGERMVRSFEFDWYFLLSEEDFDKLEGRKFFDIAVIRTEKADKYIKVFMQYYNRDRKDFIEWMEQHGCEPLEADVNPVDRFIYDHKVKFDPSPKILYYDLETDTTEGGWDDIEKHKILMVAYGESLDSMECITVEGDYTPEGEKKLIKRFLDISAGYDTLVAWNSDFYDEPVLKARTKRHSLYPNWRMVHFLDFMLLFKQYYMRDETGSGVRISFALENIAITVLGKGKIPDIPKHRMKELLQQDPEKAIKYNLRDVEIMIELEGKLGYISAHTVLAHLCNRFISSMALKTAYLVDGFVLQYASLIAKFHFGTKHQYDRDDNEPSIEGAYVMDPIVGLHEGVCDLDFSSLYPSIVIAFNISPETKVVQEYGRMVSGIKRKDLCWAANNVCFRTDKEGIFPAMSKIALQRRQSFKDEAKRLEEEGKEGTTAHRIAKQRSDAWKVLANSMYGVLASKFARYADKECGGAITGTGQIILKRVLALAEAKGIPGIYGDTDSVFLRCTVAISKEFAILAVKDVQEYFEKRGANGDWVKLKLDAEFKRLVLLAKKRYFGKKSTGKWDVRGLELIRSDNCRYTRELQRRMITFILESKTPNPKMAKRIVEKWALPLFEKKVPPEDLQVAQSLNQPLSAYKMDTIHVRIAKDLLRRGKEVYQGMKIPYIVLGKEDGKLKAVHIDDFEGEYDARIYWRGKIYPATERILNAIWPEEKFEWNQLMDFEPGGKKQTDLFVPIVKKEVVTIVLGEHDQDKMVELKRIADSFPGEHPIRLEIQINENEVAELMSGVCVSFVPDLIMQFEKAVGRRIYFGKENWDQ